MPFATAHTVSLQGALGHLIDVQADVSPGQVGTDPGRPARRLAQRGPRPLPDGDRQQRPRLAGDPPDHVLLSPADLTKRGTHFDLAIAVSVLAAAGHVPAARLEGTALIGELTLDGGLRSVPGVLPMVLAAAERGIWSGSFVPEPQAHEAAMVPGMAVIGMRSLAQVVAELRGEEVPEAPPVAAMSGSRLLSWRGAERREDLDLCRPRRHGRRAVRRRGRRRGRAPPAARPGRRDRARPASPSGSRGSCRTSPRRSRSS